MFYIHPFESDQASLLRESEEYFHLWDAVVNEDNTTNVRRLTILSSSYTSKPRHMHEYTQLAIAYVGLYVRPDLFISFACNPVLDDIKHLLLPG